MRIWREHPNFKKRLKKFCCKQKASIFAADKNQTFYYEQS